MFVNQGYNAGEERRTGKKKKYVMGVSKQIYIHSREMEGDKEERW